MNRVLFLFRLVCGNYIGIFCIFLLCLDVNIYLCWDIRYIDNFSKLIVNYIYFI